MSVLKKNRSFARVAWGAFLACISGVGIYAYQQITKPAPNIVATLYEPMPNPASGNRFQLLVVKNSGTAPAKGLEISIEYPQAGEFIDYYCDASPFRLKSPLRTATTLYVALTSLVPGEIIKCVVLIPVSEACPTHIAISHEGGVVDPRSMEYVAIKNRSCK